MLTLNFLKENWELVLLVIIILFPFIRPSWIGNKNTYWDSFFKKEMDAKKFSILSATLNLAIEPLINITSFLNLKGTISAIILSVIAFDLISTLDPVPQSSYRYSVL